MKTLNISVNNKKAIFSKREGEIVCGNTDYRIRFIFDSEWDSYEEKTARFIWNGQYREIHFKGEYCPVPVIDNTELLEVGVYVENLATTTSAKILCQRSILCGDAREAVLNLIHGETFYANGTYKPMGADGFGTVTVAVPGAEQMPKQTKGALIMENGPVTFEPDEGYLLERVDINVYVEPKLQEKTVTENGEVTMDEGFDGMSKVIVNVKQDRAAVPAGTYNMVQFLYGEEHFAWGEQELVGKISDTLSGVTDAPFTSIENDGYAWVGFRNNGTLVTEMIPSWNSESDTTKVVIDEDQAVKESFKAWFDACFEKEQSVPEGYIKPEGETYISDTEMHDVSKYRYAQIFDENLKPENIKKGVTILGIAGTYEASGGGEVKKTIFAGPYYLTGYWYGPEVLFEKAQEIACYVSVTTFEERGGEMYYDNQTYECTGIDWWQSGATDYYYMRLLTNGDPMDLGDNVSDINIGIYEDASVSPDFKAWFDSNFSYNDH